MININDYKLVTYDTDKNKAFKELILKRLNCNYYTFEQRKRINESILEEYVKIFVYKNNTIMPVNKTNSIPSGYYERVKSKNLFYIDNINKAILLLEI